MSETLCVNCGDILREARGTCTNCGALVEDTAAMSTRVPPGLHAISPLVFAAAALAFGVVGTAVSGLILGIPLGLFGGGIGVWALERWRRIIN
jgi:hypothetical protein